MARIPHKKHHSNHNHNHNHHQHQHQQQNNNNKTTSSSQGEYKNLSKSAIHNGRKAREDDLGMSSRKPVRGELRRTASCSSISDIEEALKGESSNSAHHLSTSGKHSHMVTPTRLPSQKELGAQWPPTKKSPILNYRDIPMVIQKQEDFEKRVMYWKKEGWPVKFLLTDPKSARLFEENAMFETIKFYGHKWRWDNKKGLYLYIEPTEQILKLLKNHAHEPEKIAKDLHHIKLEQKPWCELKNEINYIDNQGWIMFDGAFYGPYGFCYKTNPQERHLWKWKYLVPMFHYGLTMTNDKLTYNPDTPKPDYCYVDFLSCSANHSGLPGFGVGSPHGHVTIEFGDDLGTMWSVGQYPDPFREGSKASHVYGTCSAVLMIPDPYLCTKGDKSVHRYYIGKGETGRKRIQQLISLIQNVQKCGIIHNAVAANCGDFAEYIERFILSTIKDEAYLVDLNSESIFPPCRTKQDNPNIGKRAITSSIMIQATKFYHYFILFLVNLILTILYWIPIGSTKMGRGKGVDLCVVQDEEKEEEIEKQRLEMEQADQDDMMGIDDDFDDFDLGEEHISQSEDGNPDEKGHLNVKKYNKDPIITSNYKLMMMKFEKENLKFYKDYGALRRRAHRLITPNWPRKLRLKQIFSNRLRNHSATFTCS